MRRCRVGFTAQRANESSYSGATASHIEDVVANGHVTVYHLACAEQLCNQALQSMRHPHCIVCGEPFEELVAALDTGPLEPDAPGVTFAHVFKNIYCRFRPATNSRGDRRPCGFFRVDPSFSVEEAIPLSCVARAVGRVHHTPLPLLSAACVAAVKNAPQASSLHAI